MHEADSLTHSDAYWVGYLASALGQTLYERSLDSAQRSARSALNALLESDTLRASEVRSSLQRALDYTPITVQGQPQ